MKPVKVLMKVAALMPFVAISAATFVALALGWQLVPVLSDSMRPEFQSGDLAITRSVDVRQIAVGDVVVLRPAGAGEDVRLIHRVESKTYKEGAVVIRTKGDANEDIDDEIHRIDGGQIARKMYVVPALGEPVSKLACLSFPMRASAIVVLTTVPVLLQLIWKRPRNPLPDASSSATGAGK